MNTLLLTPEQVAERNLRTVDGYELWRRADAALRDDVPVDAVIVRLD
jgi:hypothetical protein